VLPASEVIDWTLDPGPRIGDRVDAGLEPLVPATLERIEAGLTRYADVLLDPAGDVTPLARSFVSVLRGGGSKRTGYLTDRPIPTVSAQGNHHAVVGTPAAAAERALLLAYYSNGGPARPLNQPIGTLTTRDRFALVGQPPPDQHMLVRNYSSRGAGGEMCTPVNEPARTITTRGHQSVVGWRPDRAVVDQCTFRMLAQQEIGDFMGFPSGYRVDGSDKDVKRGYGNAVPPAMAEVLVSALVEALSGEQLDPAA
jgi:DNA (cytosine-5)-methyltransferase 1